ncbi:hypothetical protein ACHQM5_003043 [Ranunculus cassubicifolius]
MGFHTSERSRSDYRDDNNYRNKDRDSDRENRRDQKKQIETSSSIEERNKSIENIRDPSQESTLEIRQRISNMKEERLKQNNGGISEVLSWVCKSRNLDVEKKKANRLSRVFDEQDDEVMDNTNLAGVRVLHGIDKVLEGGAVVLTLKDQSILADGDINDEVDMLENVDIAEQKRRDDAYKSAKKINKYSEEDEEKNILPHYDDAVKDEGVTLDEKGCLAESVIRNRKKIDGVPKNSVCYDLTTTRKISSEYYTQDEMSKFNKPKKVRPLRKKDKLDLDALEAEAVSSGFGLEDLGSRKDGKRQKVKEEQQRSEAQIRNDAYQTAFAKAEEASKALRPELPSITQVKHDEDLVFGDDDEDEFRKELEKSKRFTLKKMNDRVTSGPEAIASLVLTSGSQSIETQTSLSEEKKENKVVFREMEDFVRGLQLNEETHVSNGEAFHIDEEEVPKSAVQQKDEAREVSNTCKDELPTKVQNVANETFNEIVVGKGLANVMKLLREQGDLTGIVESEGENKEKRKGKFVNTRKIDEPKEIVIDRVDKFGRVMTQKEAYRELCHKFHGKAPGIRKQEKQRKQFEEEKKKNSYITSSSVERMREIQAETKKPFIILSGTSKLGQTSNSERGRATVEDLPQALTPLSGNRKVERVSGTKRRPELGDEGSEKKQKPDLPPRLQ